jgi:hypothetical protein
MTMIFYSRIHLYINLGFRFASSNLRKIKIQLRVPLRKPLNTFALKNKKIPLHIGKGQILASVQKEIKILQLKHQHIAHITMDHPAIPQHG